MQFLQVRVSNVPAYLLTRLTHVLEDEQPRSDAGFALAHTGLSGAVGSVRETSVVDVHIRQLNHRRARL